MIGTGAGGLSRWHDGRLMTLTTREGLPDNNISQIMEDDSQRLWLGSSRGIACLSKRNLEDLATGKITALYPQLYARAEGMPSEECTGGFCPAGLKTQSGLLWFSTLKGIVVADPRASANETPPTAVVLEELLVDGVAATGAIEKVSEWVGETAKGAAALSGSPAHSPSIRIAPGKHRVEFRYTGLNFSAPERTRFRYRLEGLDRDWVEAGAQRTAP